MMQSDGCAGLTGSIIGACIEVHRCLGPGLLESAYEECLCYEMHALGLTVERQRVVPLVYKGIQLPCAYRLDLVVDDAVLVEIKCADRTLPVHLAQVLTYLRLTGLRVGLLVNFRVPVLKDGVRRVVL